MSAWKVYIYQYNKTSDLTSKTLKDLNDGWICPQGYEHPVHLDQMKKPRAHLDWIQMAGAHLGWMPARSFLSTSSLLHPTTASGRVSPLPVVQGKSSCERRNKVRDTMYLFNLIPQFTSVATNCLLPALCASHLQTTWQRLPCKERVRQKQANKKHRSRTQPRSLEHQTGEEWHWLMMLSFWQFGFDKPGFGILWPLEPGPSLGWEAA